MDSMAAYLPQDRRQALAHGLHLPDRTDGTALFADISGFTPLTEALRLALGPRQGSETLTDHLNRTYTALMTQVDAYRGSVIGFAGDAITCWFDARRTSRRLPARWRCSARWRRGRALPCPVAASPCWR